MKPQRFTLWAMLASAALATATTLIVQQVRAAGSPAKNALTYTGFLENPDGTPVVTSKNIALAVYDAATAGTKVCEVLSAPMVPVLGRFQIALPDDCTARVGASPDLWLEVAVDGAALGRTKVGAVPYAVEAGHAVAADSAAAAANATHAAIADSATVATRSGGLNGPIEFLESVSNDNVTGTLATDLIYTKVGLDLTAGTWLVEAEATIRTTDVPDAVSIGLYDATRAVDIANSRSGIAQAGYASTPGICGLHTSRILTLTSATSIQIKGYRNGSSTLSFGYPLALAGGRNRITAMKLSDSQTRTQHPEWSFGIERSHDQPEPHLDH